MKPWIALLTGLMAVPGCAQDLGSGARNFNVFCSGCHGQDAKGNGDAAFIVSRAPPDLTGLAARNDGVFPRAYVVFKIDGRDAGQAHKAEMPPFGALFDSDTAVMATGAGQPILTTRAVADLVYWLEGVQE